MEFWLPGVAAPGIWTVSKSLEIAAIGTILWHTRNRKNRDTVAEHCTFLPVACYTNDGRRTGRAEQDGQDYLDHGAEITWVRDLNSATLIH
jgi:hypothetical protein